MTSSDVIRVYVLFTIYDKTDYISGAFVRVTYGRGFVYYPDTLSHLCFRDPLRFFSCLKTTQ